MSLRGGETAEAIFYHSDHLGSSNVITDANGSQVVSYEYTPYGSVIASPAPDGAGAKQSVAHLFTGKELNPTGLYFFEARYYDPQLARFVSADSIIPDLADPQALNPYSYCLNNPINLIDPSGNESTDLDIRTVDFISYPIKIDVPCTRWEDVLDTINSSHTVSPTNINNFMLSPAILGLTTGAQTVGRNISNWWSSNVNLDTLEDVPTALSMNPVADGMPQVPLDQGIGVIGLATAKAGRVFWSGGREAMIAAAKYANKTGRVTLEMTKAGKRLISSASVAGKERWIYASKQFAKGAEGVVHVFRKAEIDSMSIWKRFEEPVLKSSKKVTEIFEHIIK